MAKKSKGRIEKFNKNTQIIDLKKIQKEKAKEEKALKKARKKARKQEMAQNPQSQDVEFESKHDKRVKKKKNRRTLIAIAIVAVVVLVFGFSAYHIVSLKMEQKQLLAQKKTLEKQEKALKSELKTIDNPDYVEQEARKQLKLILPGETMFMVDDNKTKKDKGSGK